MAGQLVARMREFGTTIFAEMTALALETGAVNLGQGFPDTDGPEPMLAAARDAIAAGLNQYAPGPGLLELRQAIAAHQSDHYGLRYDPADEVLVTVGATEAIAAAVLALCDAGDEVIVFEPFYDSYAAVIALSGAVRRPVTLRPETSGGRFAFDPAQLRAAVGPRTRAVLVNSPHNPTGTVFSDAELAEIAEVCTGHDLVAITDEVYEHLTYDGVTHRPLATFPGMRERTVSISSAGKMFSVTGWKVGWVCARPELVRAVSTVKQFLTFTASGPFQRAVATALAEQLSWVEQLRVSLQARRDRLAAGLQQAGLTVHPSAGTYFLQVDARSIGVMNGVDLARRLPREAGVVAIPTAVFYDDATQERPYLRFAFCKRDEVLDEAVARLAAYAVTVG